MIDDVGVDRAAVRRLVLCSGKLYYDIVGHEERPARHAWRSRVSSSCIRSRSRRSRRWSRAYPSLEEIVWAQEEPQNMGPWRSIRHRLEEAARTRRRRCHVRRPAVACEPERGLPDRAPPRAGPDRPAGARSPGALSGARSRLFAAAVAAMASLGPCVRTASSTRPAGQAAVGARFGTSSRRGRTTLSGSATGVGMSGVSHTGDR